MAGNRAQKDVQDGRIGQTLLHGVAGVHKGGQADSALC